MKIPPARLKQFASDFDAFWTSDLPLDDQAEAAALRENLAASRKKESEDAKVQQVGNIVQAPNFNPGEVVVDSNGRPRQAGADAQEGEFIRQLRLAAERDLYVFCKGVLGREFLTPTLHKPVCGFIQKVPPARKLVLMPREHAKTALIAGGLPIHILIQPAEGNIYFPGMEGCECRILLCGETMLMAKKNLRVLKDLFESHQLIRALWPERCWERPKAQAPEWSGNAIIIPRKNEWPDQTIKAVGVDGAVTGSRPNVMIKDDLISIAAANSDVVMKSAIEWHKASRALLDKYEVESGLQSLEFIIGTRWAVYDLYSEIIDNDPSVEVIDSSFWSIIRDGKILWPEKHTPESIHQLRYEHGAMFYLLYMNSAADPELVDFDLDQVREFKLLEGQLLFDQDQRDGLLQQRMEQIQQDARPAPVSNHRFRGFDNSTTQREDFFRRRYGQGD